LVDFFSQQWFPVYGEEKRREPPTMKPYNEFIFEEE
jgi:hypothetical protein